MKNPQNNPDKALKQLCKSSFTRDLLDWWSAPGNQRQFLWRQTNDIYQLLIAELLLRRTNAPAVEPVYREFLEKYPSAERFACADPAELSILVRRLGLNWRAENLVSLSRDFRLNGWRLDASVDELARLPGVGPYVSRAVLLCAAHQQSVPVDSNVVRVLCRYFGFIESDSLRRNKAFQRFADSLLPTETLARMFHYALLDLAASTCRPANPRCETCPLHEVCKFRKKTKPKKFVGSLSTRDARK